jgi:hypothetical protein
MLSKTASRFSVVRYRLVALVVLIFMGMGSMIGSFEECVPLVPIVVALAVNLGWDPLMGIGMSLLAAGCGFAAGVCNPFTIGVAQQLAGLPMFSGAWLRLLSFVLIYLLVFVGGWRLLESGDMVMIEAAVAVLVGMILWLLFEQGKQYEERLRQLEQRIQALEKQDN